MEEIEYKIAIASIFAFFLIIAALALFPLVDAFIVTLVLVYLMRPINSLLVRYMSKTYAAILSAVVISVPAFLLFFYLMIATLNYIVKEKIFEKIIVVLNDFDAYSKQLIISFLEYFNIEYSNDLDKIANILTSKLHELLSYISEEIIDITIHIPEYAVKLLLASILALYLLKEGKTIKDTFINLLPGTKKKTIVSLLNGIDLVFESIVLVNILKAILTSIISYFIFLVFGVPYPAILAIMSGFMDFAPILGPWMLFSGIAVVYIMNGQAMIGIYIFIIGQLLVTVIPELYIKPKQIGRASCRERV